RPRVSRTAQGRGVPEPFVSGQRSALPRVYAGNDATGMHADQESGVGVDGVRTEFISGLWRRSRRHHQRVATSGISTESQRSIERIVEELLTQAEEVEVHGAGNI